MKIQVFCSLAARLRAALCMCGIGATMGLFGTTAVAQDDAAAWVFLNAGGGTWSGESSGGTWSGQSAGTWTGSAAWEQLGDDLVGDAENDWNGAAVALSADGSILAAGASGAPEPLLNEAGRVRVHAWDSVSGSWVQRGADIEGTQTYEMNGEAVALSADGGMLAVGAPRWNGPQDLTPEAGRVRVYAWDSVLGAWVQRGADISGGQDQARMGSAVALSADGSILAVGAPEESAYDPDDRGEVKVYVWSGSAWVQRGATIQGYASGDALGTSLALSSDGNSVVVGAPELQGLPGENGYVRVLDWNADLGSWQQRGATVYDAAEGDETGRSVALSADGEILVVGAPGVDVQETDEWGGSWTRNDVGRVSVYRWDAGSGTWQPRGQGIEGEYDQSYLGKEVVLSADGSFLVLTTEGSGYYYYPYAVAKASIYRWDNLRSVWREVGSQENQGSSGPGPDYNKSGVALSASGATVALGSPGHDVYDEVNWTDRFDVGRVQVFGVAPLLSVQRQSAPYSGQGGLILAGSLFEWSWSSDATWLKSLEASPQVDMQYFSYTVEKNTTSSPRVGTITFSSVENESFSRTLFVTQDAATDEAFNGVFHGVNNKAPGGGGAVVTGGSDNKASGVDAVVGGGRRNTASGRGSAVLGGSANTASELGALIGTGIGNLNEGRDSAVLAGSNHTIASGAIRSAIVAGKSNVLRPGADYSMIGAGRSNSVKAPDAAIAAGFNNEVAFTGERSFIGAGADNLVSGTQSAILAGSGNTASGSYAAVLGGADNTAGGDFSVVSGREVAALGNGSTYLADGVNRSSVDGQSGANHFYARFGGGYSFFTNSTTGNNSTGVTLAPNGTSWASLSSRETKEAFAPVDKVEVLEKVADLELLRWNYKSDGKRTPHMGVMAEDFHAAFGLGHDAKRIDTLNADGVQLAAIQGLYEVGKARESRLSELERENGEIREENAALRQRLEALEQRLEKAASGGR